MLGRRGSSFGLQLFSVAIVMVMFVYGFYLYKNVSHQLENVEKDNSVLVVEKEDLSRDIQVLRESKSKLEQLLKEKEKECTSNEERLDGEMKQIRETLQREKTSCDDKASLWINEKSELEQKVRNIEDERTEAKAKVEEVEEQVNSLKEENFNLKRTKQESLNDVAKLNDELANTLRKVKELTKYKDLYESQNPKTNETKMEDKKVKEDQDMQIVQPGEKQHYFEIKTAKTDKNMNPDSFQGNKSVEGQVAPPVVEKNIKDKEVDKDEAKKFKPDLPEHVIPKQSELDVGGANQVEKPDIKVKNAEPPKDKKSGELKEDDGFRGPAEKFLDDKDRDEAQANGPDDEDMADEQFEGEKVAPQVQKVPDLAANDIELQQQKRFREP